MKRVLGFLLIAIVAGLIVGFGVGPRTCLEVYRYDPSIPWTECGYTAAQVEGQTIRLPSALRPPTQVVREYTDAGGAVALGALAAVVVLLLPLAPGLARRHLAEADPGTRGLDLTRANLPR